METVVVLMAVYNGEKYLKEQLLSILHQKGVLVELLIRDDGSTDHTVSIIKGFMQEYSNIQLLEEKNVGSAQSFLTMAQQAEKYQQEYYAFADQDDIWYQDKLLTAVEVLKGREGPSLYFCGLDLIDAEGKPMGKRLIRKNFTVNKSCALVQNQATGCTMVFNKQALQLLNVHRPQAIQMHDFWMFILMSFLGSIFYDERTHMGYRQHGRNVVGAKVGLLGRWRARLKYIRRLGEHPREDMAKELLAGYGSLLSEEDVRLVSQVACYRTSLRKRLGLLFNRRIRMSDGEKDFWYRIRILMGDI
ncbi:MAG: glycosyltransferase family 2 protein [Lachnospiraceae bacterium]|nr:glycosyltransferase family 2 protein [Lachnospiraceae bacterium]